MNGFKYKLYRFMQGRRGIDNLSRFLMYAVIAVLILTMFLRKFPIAYSILNYVAIIMFIYAYYRALSRNIYKRQMENEKYLNLKYKLTKGKTFSQRRAEKQMYTFFKCPTCNQKMRAPKGQGTVMVKCHKCGNEFKKTV